ncbi:MAG: hypothetical protein ACYDEY_05570 [Acidimicrobiales bacterium]
MSVDQRKLISVMRKAVDSVEERYAGYRRVLFDYVSQVIMLEREHERRATQIQKKVSDKVDALGVLVDRNTQATP